MNRLFTLCAIGSVMLVGCADESAVESAAADVPAGATETGVPSSDPVLVSFVAGDTATLAVPEMSCPFACYPKVKETLEGMPGVESVELVEQKEEGVIDDRRVVVRFDGEVVGNAAVAALTDAGFNDSEFESGLN